MASLDTAAAGFFDAVSGMLSGLPANPITDFVSGALLLVRRTLFNQLPTADPQQSVAEADGRLVGVLGAVDPEGSALSYSLSAAPEFGTVQIAPDGVWTYTPDPEVAAGTPDSFTVTIDDGDGFNIFAPTADALRVTVPVVTRTSVNGVITTSDVSDLRSSITTGIPGEVFFLEQPLPGSSFSLLGNVWNGQFLGSLNNATFIGTATPARDAGGWVPVVGSLTATITKGCVDDPSPLCKPAVGRLQASVEGFVLLPVAGTKVITIDTLDIVGTVRFTVRGDAE